MDATAVTLKNADPRTPDEEFDPKAEVVIDATLLILTSYESLTKLTDLKKVRTMLRAEVARAGEGVVHLTPLFVYLWAVAKPWYATNDVMACVQEIAKALEQRGVRVRLPDAYRFPSRGRADVARASGRAVMGTRVGARRQRTPTPARDA